jgi:hypothetical protein
MTLDCILQVLKPFRVGTIYQGDTLHVAHISDFAQNLRITDRAKDQIHVALEVPDMTARIITFKFSTCLSAGVPSKLNKYGG